MQDPEYRELMKLVLGWVDEHGEDFVSNVITRAHLGSPDGWLVTTSNMHLLRQYRNSMSADPEDMIADSIESRGGE